MHFVSVSTHLAPFQKIMGKCNKLVASAENSYRQNFCSVSGFEAALWPNNPFALRPCGKGFDKACKWISSGSNLGSVACCGFKEYA